LKKPQIIIGVLALDTLQRRWPLEIFHSGTPSCPENTVLVKISNYPQLDHAQRWRPGCCREEEESTFVDGYKLQVVRLKSVCISDAPLRDKAELNCHSVLQVVSNELSSLDDGSVIMFKSTESE
jgi:hypothetical protein